MIQSEIRNARTRSKTGEEMQDFRPIPPDQLQKENTGIARRVSRLIWDIFGLMLIVSGLVALFGVFGISKGTSLNSLVHFMGRFFGIGRFVLPMAVMATGWLILVWRKDPGTQMHVGKVVMIEMGVLLFLGAASVFYGDTIEMVESAQSAGGIVGWGIGQPLNSLIGWVAAGLLLTLFTLLLFLAGFNGFRAIEGWAMHQIGEPITVEIPEDFKAPIPSSLLVENYSNPGLKNKMPEDGVHKNGSETVIKIRKAEGQMDLPLKYKLGGKLNRLEDPKQKNQPSPKRSNELPPLSLLEEEKITVANQATINMTAGQIEKTLADFGIPAKVVGYRVGPAVTQFAVEPGFIEKGSADEKQKVRISQISGLNKDLALALKAERLRIEAPVPGESYVGIEVPNATHETVHLRGVLESAAFTRLGTPLAVPLGRDVSGQALVSDLSSMPHLLIAGTTNSGKSICIAALTTSLIMNNQPEDLKLVMIDPKMVELNRFNGLPHLFGQVETNIERIQFVLRWATGEMDYRYKLLEAQHARNLDTYNSRMERSGGNKLPRIVIVVDELADLMMTAPETTENALVRLAQKARAVGMHLIVATQRPSTDVVTGVIKANFPTRIAFTVASMVDSRVILDVPGAETLLGKGDMLFLHPEIGVPQRAQGVMVSDEELSRVMNWWKEHNTSVNQMLPLEVEQHHSAKTPAPKEDVKLAQKPAEWVEDVQPVYQEELNPEPQYNPETAPAEEAPWESEVREGEEDGDEGLIRQATELVRREKRASASYLQRQLRIGYPKAAWLVDQLEARGVLGPAQSGGKEREILPVQEDPLTEA
ncbi:MAG: DNA translocase FtsK [Anaerolineaceae bacterium]|nr:DNA translocase FtsK [Anaerolineaceae bacterium]